MKRTLTQGYFVAMCLFALFTLSACQGGNTNTSDGNAAQAVQAYLQARVQSDLNQMINLSCAEWEAQARVEATSFKSMQASLDGVTCKDAGADGKYTLVSCQGKIITSYNGESRDWSVAERQFKVVQDGGDWHMCGYQ